MFPNIVMFAIIFLYGIIIGSFLNVCIYRIPKKENIVTTRSHCMSCDYSLKWYDLIPIFSYLALIGHCRKCGEKISPQYPLIELLNGVLYVLIFVVRGFSTKSVETLNYNLVSVLFCLAVSALLVLSVIDFKIYEIPVEVNYFLLVIGLIRVGLDYMNWVIYLIGFIVVSFFLYLIFVISKGRAIGGGDIKLMAVGGLLLGWQGILLAFILGCIFGSVIHLIRMKISHTDKVLALGPYLSIGMLIVMLYGNKLWAWYLGGF